MISPIASSQTKAGVVPVEGYINSKGVHVDLKNWETAKQVVDYSVREPLAPPKSSFETCFSFFEEELFDVLLKRQKEGAKPVGLARIGRFSSDEGKSCQRSNLPLVLETRRDPLPTEGGIYCPGVKIFRGVEGQPIDSPEETAVVAASASNEKSDVLSRLRNQFRVAAQNGHEEIVLEDDNEIDPLIYAHLFKEPEFKGWFKRVDFACLKSRVEEGKKSAAFRELCNWLNERNKKIDTPWTSDRFDLAVSSLALASLFMPQYGNFFVSGLQGFAVANLADRCLRRYFLPPMDIPGRPILPGTISALIEEGIYNGILKIQGVWGAILRLPMAWVVGETAARGILTNEKQPDQRPNEKTAGFSKTAKIGALWAAFREITFSLVPSHFSVPILLGADSGICALSEVCPKNNEVLHMTVSSREWTYKALSAGVFRTVANFVGLQSGIAASFAHHILFNVSRALPEKA